MGILFRTGACLSTLNKLFCPFSFSFLISISGLYSLSICLIPNLILIAHQADKKKNMLDLIEEVFVLFPF